MTTQNTKNMNNYTDKINQDKLAAGDKARQKYSKLPKIIASYSSLIKMDDFNKDICESSYIRTANILFDDRTEIQQVLRAVAIDKYRWLQGGDKVYSITIDFGNGDHYILKFGGSRKKMSKRWGSYTAGRNSTYRKNKKGEYYTGTQSETYSYIHDTIEDGLLRGYKFSIWVHNLPTKVCEENVYGKKKITIEVQRYHGWEASIIELYKEVSGGKLPLLCDNADPKYR